MLFVNKKKTGLKFPRQLTAEVFLSSLLPKFSSVVNYSRFHNSTVNCRGTFLSFTCVNNNFHQANVQVHKVSISLVVRA